MKFRAPVNESEVKMFLRGGRRVRPLQIRSGIEKRKDSFSINEKGYIYTRQCDRYNLMTISVMITSDRT